MYSSSLKTRDKSGAVAAALAIQAALLVAFLNMSGPMDRSDTQAPLRLVDVPVLKAPPPVVERRESKPRKNQGGSSARNIKSEATAVIASRPVLAPPIRAIAATTTPRDASEPTQGAAPVRGTGTGGGGTGNGNGTGSGNGSGDGGGAFEPPHLATPVLSGYDFPRELIDQWPRAATIFLRLKINARGYVSECLVDRGTNVPVIDSQMCNMAHERLHFFPALDRSGQAVAGWFGYAQPAPR